MRFPKRLQASILVAAVAVLTTALNAQEIKRTELKRTESTDLPDKDVIVMITEIPPGATLSRHAHHGDEAFYILEGATIQRPGSDPQLLPTGLAGVNKRDVPHAGYKVVGDKSLRILNVFIVDRGKPLSVDAE